MRESKNHANPKVKIESITRLRQRPVSGEGKITHVLEVNKYNTSFFRAGIEFMSIGNESMQGIISHIQQGLCQEAKKEVLTALN